MKGLMSKQPDDCSKDGLMVPERDKLMGPGEEHSEDGLMKQPEHDKMMGPGVSVTRMD
jgi:hypothetical protein